MIALSGPARWLRRLPLVEFGFCSNAWVWAHMLLSGAAALALRPHLDAPVALGCVVVAAVAWEAVEAFIERPTATYESVRRWAWDCAGDVIGATAVAAMVLR